jgi:hypothetical protein
MERRNSLEITLPTTPRPRPSMLGSRRTAMRVMHRKSQGIVAVYEQDPIAASAGTRTLVFESPTSCTRVVNFPEQWQRLSDDELVAIRRAAG